MTIWDILADNQRVILWSDEEAGLIYTWNYSQTLQCYAYDHGASMVSPECADTFSEVDIRTLSDKPKNARQELQRWHKERMQEGYQGAV